MYIVDGIAYGGDPKPLVKIQNIRPLPKHRLWVQFNTGETKTVDFAPLLDSPAFSPLKDAALFRAVSIDHGVPVWDGGNIDIAPEYLYAHGQDGPEDA